MEIIIRNTINQPIYEQISTQLKNQIIAGTLKPGEALPSIRALAKDLKISVITTKRAYEELDILTAGIHNRQKGLKYALLAHIAATPLFMNDCTLFVDLLRVKQQSVGPVMKYKQTRILN